MKFCISCHRVCTDTVLVSGQSQPVRSFKYLWSWRSFDGGWSIKTRSHALNKKVSIMSAVHSHCCSSCTVQAPYLAGPTNKDRREPPNLFPFFNGFLATYILEISIPVKRRQTGRLMCVLYSCISSLKLPTRQERFISLFRTTYSASSAVGVL